MSRTYQTDETSLGDVFYAPGRVRFARPRSKALVGPMGGGPAPWLRPKEDMHVRGMVPTPAGRGYGADQRGCHVPPTGRRGRPVCLMAPPGARPRLATWGWRCLGRLTPPREALHAPGEVGQRLQGAGKALYGAAPPSGGAPLWGALLLPP